MDFFRFNLHKRKGMEASTITVAEFRKLKPRKSKYGNTRVKVKGADGKIMTFDSLREYRRWITLNILLKAGEIHNLQRQVKFNLGVCNYICDFKYMIHVGKNGFEEVVEDVKSVITRKNRVYRIKKKMMKQFLGITILET